MILKYTFIFLALLAFGTIADVPVMFLAMRGEISLAFVIIVGFATDIASDFFWYWLGEKIGIERFQKLRFFRNNPERMALVGRALDKYGMLLLFASKFIHSFGVPTQIVSGAHRYPLKKMFIANALGGVGTIVVIYAMAKIFTSEAVVEEYLGNAKLALLAFVVVLVGLHFLVSAPLKKYFSRS
jgi:membrane protein DedA with SNARE-associated domain